MEIFTPTRAMMMARMAEAARYWVLCPEMRGKATPALLTRMKALEDQI